MNLFRAHSSPDLSLALPTDKSHTRLFGVDLSKPPMKKFKSMIDLNTYPSSSDTTSLSPNQSRQPSSSSDHNYHSNG
ncbi:hypothetical protein QJS10_CPA03g01247 [Acorus calamus]|uniref:Uncharacterized protein n=1 Tax=Acorus calamus TaxID=4465 RepID=A0AAV9FAF0_ACOCL|nr:hypothetical protein QJS10_CPA03g01247 [Acorus calamus]